MPSIAPMSAAARAAASGIPAISASKSSAFPAVAMAAWIAAGASSAVEPSSTTRRRMPRRFRHCFAVAASRSPEAPGTSP